MYILKLTTPKKAAYKKKKKKKKRKKERGKNRINQSPLFLKIDRYITHFYCVCMAISYNLLNSMVGLKRIRKCIKFLLLMK